MNHMKQSCRGGLGGIRSVTAFIANIAVSLALIAVLPIMVIWPFGGSHRPTVDLGVEPQLLERRPGDPGGRPRLTQGGLLLR